MDDSGNLDHTLLPRALDITLEAKCDRSKKADLAQPSHLSELRFVRLRQRHTYGGVALCSFSVSCALESGLYLLCQRCYQEATDREEKHIFVQYELYEYILMQASIFARSTRAAAKGLHNGRTETSSRLEGYGSDFTDARAKWSESQFRLVCKSSYRTTSTCFSIFYNFISMRY